MVLKCHMDLNVMWCATGVWLHEYGVWTCGGLNRKCGSEELEALAHHGRPTFPKALHMSSQYHTLGAITAWHATLYAYATLRYHGTVDEIKKNCLYCIFYCSICNIRYNKRKYDKNCIHEFVKLVSI